MVGNVGGMMAVGKDTVMGEEAQEGDGSTYMCKDWTLKSYTNGHIIDDKGLKIMTKDLKVWPGRCGYF